MNDFMATLPEFYDRIRTLQGSTAMVTRVPLLLTLLLVGFGNEKPGFKLLSWVLAAHFFIGLYVTVGEGGAAMLLIPIHLAMLGVLIWSAYKEEARWAVLPENEAYNIPIMSLYLVAFWFPFFPPGFRYSDLFFSPMGILPHQSLLVCLILTGLSRGRVSTILGWTVIGCAVYLALLEALSLRILTAVVFFGAAAVVSPGMLVTSVEGSEEEKERAPATPARQIRQQRPKTVEAQPKQEKPAGRKWDIR